MTQKIASYLSLSMKAGKLHTGEAKAEKLLKSGEAILLIVASDASANTQKKFINKCFYYKVPILVFGEKESLSKYVGQQNRTVLTLTDVGLAGQLRTLIQKEQETIYKEGESG